MILTVDDARVVKLPSGTLTLEITNDALIDDLCDFAARANPRRGFLVVSTILGRHIPAAPSAMRRSMNQLGAMLSPNLPDPVVFLGMAETATALGQGVFAAYQRTHRSSQALYLQTSRQKVHDAKVIATFEEYHSHATSHIVQVANDRLLALVSSARTLVIIDDECSSGNTFIGSAQAMMKAMPQLERIETCCLTDWSGLGYIKNMPLTTTGHAILRGRMDWQANPWARAPELPSSSNGVGAAPVTGMKSRAGIYKPEQAYRGCVNPWHGERILVLGEGEHSYEALLIAEEIESKGGVAAVQCITRTPAVLGHAMKSVSHFEDSYGSGAPCYLYNILKHAPDRIIIATEIEGRQVSQAQAAVAALGRDVPIESILCQYQTQEIFI
jgi:hypothetical protein